MKPLPLTAFTASSCLGTGLALTWEALLAGRHGLKPCQFEDARLPTYVGEVEGLDAVQLPAALRAFDCRNNRLALHGLQQDGFFDAVAASRARYGAGRIGVFIGTSTSGILQTEMAYRRRDPVSGALPADFDYRRTHNSFSVTEFVRSAFALQGPAVSICTACSSSAKVFAAAARMIEADLIDAAVVGGVDSLCLTTLYGFHSLQLTAREPCRPFDVAREGLSIGEAAAFALLEREPGSAGAPVWLLGSGESSDAHHMSSPHPEGLGARLAMQAALDDAQIRAEDIDYINLHGTGTPSNDNAESRAVHALFGTRVACSSTKGATGHTLGAAGALEAVICALALRGGVIPGGVQTQIPDPALQVRYLLRNEPASPRYVLSNSFGFGGANCSLLFGRHAS